MFQKSNEDPEGYLSRFVKFAIFQMADIFLWKGARQRGF